MAAAVFEFTTPWGDAGVAETSAEARKAACLMVFFRVCDTEETAEEAYDALTRHEQFALWKMLEGMGAKLRRVPAEAG